MVLTSLSSRTSGAVNTFCTSLERMYLSICYLMGRIKSLIGKGRFIFLSEANLSWIYVAVTNRIAIKSDTDQRADIRTIHGDIASYFSTACAIACSGGSAMAAYIFGAFFAIGTVTLQIRDSHMVSAIPFVAWSLAPENEGGIGFPLFRTFHGWGGRGQWLCMEGCRL